MNIGKVLVAGLAISSLVTPAFAAGERAVRPSVKLVKAAGAQDRNLVMRSGARTGAKLESESNIIGLPLLFLVAGVAAAAVVAVAVSEIVDDSGSPGS